MRKTRQFLSTACACLLSSSNAVFPQQSRVHLLGSGKTLAAGPVQHMPPPAVVPVKPAEEANEEQRALEQLKPVVTIAGAWLKRPELQRSYVGLEIMDIPSGRVIFSYNGEKRFVSASTAKVFTTACTYETFGAAYRYHTTLVGYGEIHGERLTGPLVIVPSQDPTFTYADLRELLQCLSGRVKIVSGQALVSSVPGGGDHFSSEWLVQDWAQDWMPVSSDLIVDRNVVPARDPGRGYPLAIVGADAEPNALFKTLLQSSWAPAWVMFNRNSNTVMYYRPDQPASGAFTVANPSEFNAAVSRAVLRSQGIKIENHDLPFTQQIILGDHASKPLSEIIRHCLKESDNLYAQQFLRTLGTQPALNKALENASLEERGLARLNAWFAAIGVPAGDAILFDGCGLSRKNGVAPHALNVVLRHMAGPTGNGPFIDLMTHEGEGATHNFRFKTGSMDSVRSITGVVRTSTGQPMAVTAIINDHTPEVRELRSSLNGLINQLQSLGSVRLKQAPAVTQHVSAGGGGRRKRHRR